MDQIQYGNIHLKVVVLVQIVFTTWGYLPPPGGFMPAHYAFVHSILFLFAALAIAKPRSPDLVMMYLLMNVFTILNDIILLSLFQPYYQSHYQSAPGADTYRFALGMVIVNLILKPIVCFVLYRVYLSRGGSLNEELNSLRGRPAYSGYDQLDDSVETASPHRRLDNSPPPSNHATSGNN